MNFISLKTKNLAYCGSFISDQYALTWLLCC
jgi:hypothetical protein